MYRHCLSFVYADLIETALDEFKARWNSHSIRPSRLAGCPSGVPDDLYNLPEINGMIPISTEKYNNYAG